MLLGFEEFLPGNAEPSGYADRNALRAGLHAPRFEEVNRLLRAPDQGCQLLLREPLLLSPPTERGRVFDLHPRIPSIERRTPPCCLHSHSDLHL